MSEKNSKATIKTLILTTISFLIIGAIVTGFSQFLYSAVAINAVEAMKSIIEANTALIGFLAVIAIFLMTSAQSLGRRINNRLIEEKKRHQTYLDKGDGSDFYRYRENKLELIKLTNRSNIFLSYVFLGLFASAICFITSILTALLGMSTDSVMRLIGFSASIILLVYGITIIFYVLLKYKDILQKYYESEWSNVL